MNVSMISYDITMVPGSLYEVINCFIASNCLLLITGILVTNIMAPSVLGSAKSICKSLTR